MRLTFKMLLTTFGLLQMTLAFSQGVVVIDHKTHRFLNDASTLDRTKYTNAHVNFQGVTDPDFNQFKVDYNIQTDYVGGRSFWNPASKVKNGVLPNVGNKYTGVREVYPWYVAGGKQDNLFFDKTVDYAVTDITQWSKDLANYVAQSLKSDWDWPVKYLEPFNEPMVHADEFYPDTKKTAEKTNAVITKICEYHRDLGQAIHNTPELANIEVMGFASAWPEFDKNNFGVWDERYKKFMDIAGADVDIFSLHLYDSDDGTKRRSGSNSEALLDIIEAYSYIKFGVVKPTAVTEYGRLVPNQDGWVAGGTVSNYNPITNSQAVRSQLHLLMNFMERGNDMAITIPFNVDTRDITSQYSKSTLFVPNGAGGIERTMRKYTYEMLKDLKGERVRIKSSNIDVQTQAFADGNHLYVMLNNLNDDTQTVELNLIDQTGLISVDIKSLKIFEDKLPELTNTTVSSAPSSQTLMYGETVVLTYNFDAPITFDNTIVSKKYYSSGFMKAITANTFSDFTFNNVEVGYGEASIHLGVGRELNLSLRPIITVNSVQVEIPDDIIRGYNQVPRGQFFGVLEVPLRISLLKAGSNTVSVKFPDNGGYVASAILKVQKAESPLVLATAIRPDVNDFDLQIYPNLVVKGDPVNVRVQGTDVKYSIYSLNGTMVLQGTRKQIDTGKLNAGVYVVKLLAGDKQSCQKLVVK